MIMLGSKFPLKGSLKCSQLGLSWLKNKQISYVSPNCGGSDFESPSCGVRFKGPASPSSCGWGSSAGYRVGQPRSIPAVPKIQPPASNRMPAHTIGCLWPRHPAATCTWKRWCRESKSKCKPSRDDDRQLLLTVFQWWMLWSVEWGDSLAACWWLVREWLCFAFENLLELQKERCKFPRVCSPTVGQSRPNCRCHGQAQTRYSAQGVKSPKNR